MEDRVAINEQMKIQRYFPDFFSVLLPELGRPKYLRKCLEYLHEYADMPIEVIVHEDGGGPQKQQEIASWRDMISTLILNHGYNTGLARSFNRCRAMASSPYLFGFNTDTYMTSPFLKNVKAALALPYVGIVNIIPFINEGPGVHITPEGVKMVLLTKMGHCQAFGIRAEVWDELGGWNEYVQTTSSDVGFVGNLFGAGYFAVQVEGTTYNEMWLNDGKINIQGANSEYISAADFTRDDMNVPHIFKMQPGVHSRQCRQRWEAIYLGVNRYLRENSHFASWHNANFIVQECGKLFRNNTVENIDWEFAKTYGHDKWKDRIIEDFNLG